MSAVIELITSDETLPSDREHKARQFSKAAPRLLNDLNGAIDKKYDDLRARKRSVVSLFLRYENAQEIRAAFADLAGDPEALNPNRKIFEARKRETAALGAGEKLVLGHPLAATIGDSARCMQNLEKVLFTGPKTSDTLTFICD